MLARTLSLKSSGSSSTTPMLRRIEFCVAIAGVGGDSGDHQRVGFRDIAQEAFLLRLLHGEAAHDEDAGQHFVETRVDLRPTVEERSARAAPARARPAWR